MEENQNYILTASAGDLSLADASLPDALQQFYDSFKDKTVGDYTLGAGFGMEDMAFGPVTITIDNTRLSVVSTNDYESATNKNMGLLVLQGYAQISIFNRFYGSCVMIGEYSPVSAGSVVSIVNHLTRTQEEREELEKKKIEEVKFDTTFYQEITNDPINDARNTCGIYIITDNSDLLPTITCKTVFEAIGLADFADNPAFGLAVAVCANVNTFTNSMTFSVAAYMRLGDGPRFTIAGEIGMLNGKLNSIGLAVKKRIPIMTEVYITQGKFTIKGFQESKIAVGLGVGMAMGPEIKTPGGLSWVQKALFPNLKSFCPLTLSVKGAMDPLHDYYSLSGEGVFMGNFSVSASVSYDAGNLSAELKAGTVRNNYLNGSLSVDFHKKQDNWSLHGNFNCSVTIDLGSLFGVAVSGGVDVLLNSQNYTYSGNLFNRKDLTVSVFGMGKVKVVFSFNLSVNKTWVFNLSNTRLSDPNLLMRSISTGDTTALEDIQDVMVCESKDIAENQLPQLRSNCGVIETKSWQIDEQCSASGLVKIQVAAEYTLVDSNWRLTHSDGNTTTVYTAENSAGVISVHSFAHNYYELLLDTPEVGSWTLEILGDSKNSGGIYLDALQDEKIETQLEIIEQTDDVIKFRYKAFTGSADDTTLVRLFAEEISSSPGDNPYSGIIAYLEETENGEFIWEIPEEFRHNAKYRFYISTASSDAGSIAESNGVEVYLARQDADLDCSWELAYNADNSNTVTAYITVTNTGTESTKFLWEILDYTNTDSIDTDDIYFGDNYEVIASAGGLEIAGNSSITFQQVITVTDELRDNPSSLLLSVTQETENGDAPVSEYDENHADDTDEILFSAVDSEYCQEQTIHWQAVEGAAYYILHYALEGDWDESGVYVNNIYSTSYVLSVAPGEYTYRVIAIGSDGNAINSWSEEEIIDVLFHDKQTISIAGNISSSRSQLFSLNDGLYDLKGIDLQNFTGTLTLFRDELVKTGETEYGVIFDSSPKKILTLTIVNGVLQNPVSEILLDHGDYFWKWSRSENISDSDFDITLEISGEVFPFEQIDREIISIGDDTAEMPLISGAYVETLEGEVGVYNEDAIYQYMTDDGGELSLTIKSGTVFDTDVKLHIYVQDWSDGEFDCVKTLTVTSGEYAADTVILDKLSISNNFYVQVESADNADGEYYTDYSFDLSFDTFEDTIQSTDILVVNGEAVRDWIGFRNEAHSYLLQIDANGQYAVRLQGDAGDAVLKVCQLNGTVIDEISVGSNGIGCIDNIYLESGNYFVVVESYDQGEGSCNTDYALSVVTRFSGNADGLCWEAVPGAAGYIVEYSTDNFAHSISIETTGNKIDSIALPSGSYQWRVTAIGADFSCEDENLVSEQTFTEAQIFVSNANGNTDLFFANANGQWSVGYAAQHSGILNGWSGTNEQRTLFGKNKLSDIFEGSSDANILVMTDDSNGDALFVDDIYTALPGTVSEQQGRIAQIDEIRAGLGDDIVDMTSQRFAYAGDGVKIYGGLGDDTIWANNGNNSLFGDAGSDRIVGGENNDVIVGGSGNDRMHGGGGEDIFCFGKNWGKDTVEQLDDGEITLWFESGEIGNWNASTLTYTDGKNSVKVSGVSVDNITLIFGNDGSPLYDELTSAGCFDDAASEKIFEDKNKGVLA